VMRVTFDTNVLDLACRPERFPKDPRQTEIYKVHNALKSGQIEGFYSVTMITIEAIMRTDRAAVFSGTKITTKRETTGIIKNADLPKHIREEAAGKDVESITIEFQVEQSRKNVNPEFSARMRAAKDLGVKVLKDVPRIGAFKMNDPTNEYYLSNGDGHALENWIEKAFEVIRALEARGIGIAQLKALGRNLNFSDPELAWYKALDTASNIHQQRAIERAFAEWADGDAIAAHIAYGIDIFCSADVGNSNVANSVLDPQNRAWLTSTYGTQFESFEDLAALL
jgi:hypothetical protein